jgi:hypothetical protein
MSSERDGFRRRCRQFQLLAWFMIASVGGVLALLMVVAPAYMVLSGERAPQAAMLSGFVWHLPALFYLYGVWAIGEAVGQIGRGRLIQTATAEGLRRAGLALGAGGVLSVFVVVNLMRLVMPGYGGYLHFDVGGMTLGMVGGAMFLLGRVMDRAAAVQSELDEMV